MGVKFMVYSVARIESEGGNAANEEAGYQIIAAAHNVDGEMDRPAPVSETVYPNENEAVLAAYALLGDDDLAISAFRGLRDLGIRLPDDVALIGCDGIEDTEYHDPAISTVVQPLKEMCSFAWDSLERRLREPGCDLAQKILKPELALRESTRS